MATVKKSLATLNSPIIQAVIGGQYRFKTKDDAIAKIAFLKNRFVQSKLAKQDESELSAIVWIKDYELIDKETADGLLGNFALVSIVEDTKEKRFYLSAQKLPAAAKYHPKRIRPRQKTPDFGHWVLRRVQKNWWYPTIEEATADLAALAEEFPQVCIPATNKLYAMIYRSAPKGEKPVKRYVLEIKAHEQGGFMIALSENTYVAKPKAPKKAVPVRETAGETQGKFTAMEKLKRSRKRTDTAAG